MDNDCRKRHVLFVDDEPNVTEGLKRMLRPLRNEWELFFAQSAAEGLEIMDRVNIDVIVSDMRMPVMDGAQLLATVQKKHPGTIRIVLSGQSSREAILKAAGAAHQYFSKPCDAETIKQTVSRAFLLRDVVSGERLRNIASKMQNLPVLPKTYTQLMEEMRKDEPSLQVISKLVSEDVAMTAKILQVVNSAYFGIRRQITTTDDAIKYLGLENVSALVLAANVFSQFETKLLPSGFSMTSLWDHSGEVGRLSQVIMKAEHKPKHEIDNALTAGLLHDCGKLILAVNLPQKYGEIIALAKQSGEKLETIERNELDADHAEVGAYLLGIWGLPDSIVEATAFHHNPEKFQHKGCNALTAVHVANCFANNSDLLSVNDKYLEECGVTDRVSHWISLMSENKN